MSDNKDNPASTNSILTRNGRKRRRIITKPARFPASETINRDFAL